MTGRTGRLFAVAILAGCQAGAQTGVRLTLSEAEAVALKNNPRVTGAQLNALAAGQVAIEARSALFPLVSGAITSAGATHNAQIAAGGFTNSSILDRAASGLSVSQLITDFGRTRLLVESAGLRAQATNETTKATGADVLLAVDGAYYGALRAQSILQVAEQTVASRQLIVDQVTALAQSKLKSGLDVSFAQVNLSDAQLLLIGAQNEVRAQFTELSNAMGRQDHAVYELVDQPLPGPLDPDPAPLIEAALRTRPELAGARLESEALRRTEKSERSLWLPAVSAVSSIGFIPVRDDKLPSHYAAAGINIGIPIFNGKLFTARRSEAEYRALASEQRTRELENTISRDVEIAWLRARTAEQRLSVTAALVRQATEALDLAQTRYDLGLSSIIELSQAQLNRTSAEIANAGAKYDYQIQRAVLSHQIGTLR